MNSDHVQDRIVFDSLSATPEGFWRFTARVEIAGQKNEGSAFTKAFSKPLDLPILAAHDPHVRIGHIKGDGSGKFTGWCKATLQHRMALGIGFKQVRSRNEEGIRILEEVELLEVSIFPFDVGPTI